MKKVLSIALATLLCLTAFSALAIVNREEDPTDKKVVFDSVSISTAYALTDYALMGVSTIADPLKTYVGNEVIFGYLKYTFDDNRTKDAENIDVQISSDYASFPMYLNTGGIYGSGVATVPSKAHYLDKNGILQAFANNSTAPGTNGGMIGNPFTTTSNSDEEFVVKFDSASFYGASKAYTTFVSSVPSYLSKNGSKYACEIYVGFNGVVKASTASEGKIRAYVTVAGSKFAEIDYSANPANWTNNRFQWVGVNAGHAWQGLAYTPYIDVYDNGKHLYRVYSLFNVTPAGTANTWLDGTGQSYAFEYLVQPVDSYDDDILVDWAVGFQNLNKSRFGKITYRKGLPTSKDNWDNAATGGAFFTNNGFEDLLIMYDKTTGGQNDYSDRCYVRGGGAAYNENQFFELVGGFNANGTPKNPDDIAPRNALDSKVKPIMDWFGFTLGYYNATRDSDYENKAGWKATKEATFKYFGVEVPIADDDVPAPETGDASTAIVIVLAGSALLAAAALFFVLKKARD